MFRSARLLCILCFFTLLCIGRLFAQVPSTWPCGLLVSKDPQTAYITAFEYLAAEPLNQYVTKYTLAGGLTRQIPNSAVIENVRYPRSATESVPRVQIEGNLRVLDDLTRRYPQHATLFAASAARLRTISTQATATVPPPVLTSPMPGVVASLTLRDGTRYLDFTILHTDGDRFTIRHQKGIAEVLLRDLPADPKGLPPAVQTLCKAYQDRVAKEEAARKQAQLAASSPTPTPNSVLPVTNTPASSPSSPASVSPVAPSKWRTSVLPGLTIKGLSIGMDGAEAAKVLVEQNQGKLAVEATPISNEHGYEVYLLSQGRKASGRIGHLRVDPQDGTLIMFIFEPMLSNFLFNTADQSADEFAQTFINAYDVPTIKPTTVGNSTRCWTYASKEGWTLYLYTDKAVQVMRTPERKFD